MFSYINIGTQQLIQLIKIMFAPCFDPVEVASTSHTKAQQSLSLVCESAWPLDKAAVLYVLPAAIWPPPLSVPLDPSSPIATYLEFDDPGLQATDEASLS